MAGHFIDSVEDQRTGRPVSGATVKVYQDGATISADGNTVLSGTLATIYSDDGVTEIDQTNAPLTTEPNGRFDFYTDETRVIIAFLFNGVSREVWNDVDIIGGTVSSDVTALAGRVDNHDTLLGYAANSTDLGTFTGSIITDNVDLQTALQELETAAETNATAISAIGTVPTEASASEIWTGSETGKYLSPDKLFDSAAPTTLSDAATIAVDMATGINFNVTLGGNRTLGNPTNAKAGQSGRIRVVQDGTGSRTLAFASNWKHVGSAPTIATAAAAVDLFAYFVNDSTNIELSYLGTLA